MKKETGGEKILITESVRGKGGKGVPTAMDQFHIVFGEKETNEPTTIVRFGVATGGEKRAGEHKGTFRTQPYPCP